MSSTGLQKICNRTMTWACQTGTRPLLHCLADLHPRNDSSRNDAWKNNFKFGCWWLKKLELRLQRHNGPGVLLLLRLSPLIASSSRCNTSNSSYAYTYNTVTANTQTLSMIIRPPACSAKRWCDSRRKSSEHFLRAVGLHAVKAEFIVRLEFY
jgi:hypothetical protein